MTTQMMTLPEIQNAVHYSCDFCEMTDTDHWLEMITGKASDSGFGHLVESILEVGLDPACPVVIMDGEIQDGHHRLVAAILLCLPEVPVSDRHTYGDLYGICAHLEDDAHPIFVEV
jgi:hypothetical protein